MTKTRIVQIGATVEEVPDWEEVVPFGPTQARAPTWIRVPARPSVRDTQPVRDAQHMAEVAKNMKDFNFDRRDAERFVEIEAEMDGSDWAKRQQGEQK